jgi:hypothetical protein
MILYFEIVIIFVLLNNSVHCQLFINNTENIFSGDAYIQKIKSIKVLEPEIDCYSKYVPIEIEILDATKKFIPAEGFLNERGGLELQQKKEECRLFRKYFKWLFKS